MTKEELLKDLKRLEEIAYDSELAHTLEDNIREKVLIAIVNGAENAKELAEMALKTSDVDFRRWYA